LIAHAKNAATDWDRGQDLDGGLGVPYYRIYFVGPDGHFKSAAEVTYKDDDEAIEAAEGIARGKKVELWSGGRRVAIINNDDTPKT
jgi:hypothetical protein